MNAPGAAALLVSAALLATMAVRSRRNRAHRRVVRRRAQPADRQSAARKAAAIHAAAATTAHLGPVTSLQGLYSALDAGTSLDAAVVMNLDLRGVPLRDVAMRDALLLGCEGHAESAGALAFPRFPPSVPYNPYRANVYTADELYDAFDVGDPASYEKCFDFAVYHNYLDAARPIDVFAQRVHDHCISQALARVVAPMRHIVAVLGGHELLRHSDEYMKTVLLARELTQSGFVVATGGGPGAMEAANLGAYTANEPVEVVRALVASMSVAPHYKDARWLAAAWEARARVDPATAADSLGIPTYFYGHEPSNCFATHIAKFFQNSVREDGLLKLANAGAVFLPGSAGTMQEVFMELSGNHYTGAPVPMVFWGSAHWNASDVMPVLRFVANNKPYQNLISVVDDGAAAMAVLKAFATN